MTRAHHPEPGGYIDQAARVGWDERGSFGFDVVRRTARDMTPEDDFFTDYCIVALIPDEAAPPN